LKSQIPPSIPKRKVKMRMRIKDAGYAIYELAMLAMAFGLLAYYAIRFLLVSAWGRIRRGRPVPVAEPAAVLLPPLQHPTS
jgi:hypothetical protein